MDVCPGKYIVSKKQKLPHEYKMQGIVLYTELEDNNRNQCCCIMLHNTKSRSDYTGQF